MIVVSAVTAMLASSGCGKPESNYHDVDIGPDRVVACCDPDGVFPQEVGTVDITNDNSQGVLVVQPGHEDRAVDVGSYGEESLTLVVDACGDQDLELKVDADTPGTFVVHFEDRCPVRTDDPDDGLSQPSLDLLHCDCAYDADDQPWIDCETGGAWPPDSLLYSWFLSIAISNGGAPSFDCTDQHHDGVDSRFCDAGDVGGVTMWYTQTGVVMLFPAGTVSDYSVDCGYLETQASTFVEDTLVGTCDASIGAIEPPPQQ